MSNITIGQTIFEQFRVDSFIASGGMGAVYRVWDLKRNVSLAMKILHGDLADDPHIFKYFEREARALKKLAHPNIVPFYGLYRDDDFAFILEKFVDGPSLANIFKQNKGQPLPLNEAMPYLKAMSAALGYAHANGVIHCDVKPGNVMIERNGNIYLADFGIARHAESSTTTMASAGTPAYMAPEQIRGEPVTAATDIYALGIVFFEMLTGERPFRGIETGPDPSSKTMAERIRHEHLYVPPPDPQQINPSISSGIAASILKCLEKNPEDRYATTQEMFLSVCAAAGITESEIANHTQIVDTTATARTPSAGKLIVSPESQKPGVQKQNLPILGMGVLVILLASLAVWGISKIFSPQGTTLPLSSSLATKQGSPMSNAADTSSPTATAIPAPTETTTLIASATPVELRNDKDDALIIFIPAGEFVMGVDKKDDPNFFGAEGPAHKVILNEFYIYRTEVTNGMYALCTKEKKCPRPGNNTSQTRKNYFGNSQFDKYPVIWVTWVMADTYCKWAGARLPTEAEWEKAARGTDARRFPWGNEPPKKEFANFASQDTMPVGKYPAGASPYGILDMAGNVHEWVHDIFAPEYYKISPEENPLGPDTGSKRVFRGGSWFNGASSLRIVARASLKMDDVNDSVGFRCAKDTP